jgi:hypothetical protein
MVKNTLNYTQKNECAEQTGNTVYNNSILMVCDLLISVKSQGVKRSITRLRGGTLGYAEVIAIKVSP